MIGLLGQGRVEGQIRYERCVVAASAGHDWRAAGFMKHFADFMCQRMV